LVAEGCARKAPVLAEAARAMALSAPEGLKASATARCCCWASQARFAGPLVALDVADLEETEEGFKIIIRRS
jgi:hypothetical protein